MADDTVLVHGTILGLLLGGILALVFNDVKGKNLEAELLLSQQRLEASQAEITIRQAEIWRRQDSLMRGLESLHIMQLYGSAPHIPKGEQAEARN